MSIRCERPWTWALLILLIAIVVNMAAGLTMGIRRPVISDGRQFLVLAQSLARGDGYRCSETFWPDSPSMQRMPGWPLVIAAGLRLTSGVDADVAMRVLCLLLNAAVAVIIFFLTLQLFNRVSMAVVAGLLYVMNPTGIYLAYNGLSETLFLVLAGGGLVLIVGDGRWKMAGFLLLGCACLERANFLVWVVCFTMFLLAYMVGVRRPTTNLSTVLSLKSLVFGVVLFVLPPLLWVGRNYMVSGHFPVLSTLRGAAVYGSNNPMVASDLKYWGYWVFPDQISGETPQVELAKNMSEYDVDVYYFNKGIAYIRHNWFAMPRLLVGKLVRAYIPVPWKPDWGTYLAGCYRVLVFLFASIGVWVSWKKLGIEFKCAFLAMAMANVLTVLIFYGYARFAFSFEAFLLPFAVVGLFKGWEKNVSRGVRILLRSNYGGQGEGQGEG